MDPTIANAATVANLGLEHKTDIRAGVEAPLVILVHGRAGTYSLMWTFKRALPEGINIIAVQAPLQDPIGGWSWWQVSGATKEIRVGEIDDASQKLKSFIERCIKHYDLAPSNTLALGFSQGAALLSRLILERPQSLQAVALLAGFVLRPGDFNETPGLLDGKPIFIGHGTLDDVVPVEKAQEGRALLEKLGANVTWSTDEVGHKLGSATMRELKDWCHQRLSNRAIS